MSEKREQIKSVNIFPADTSACNFYRNVVPKSILQYRCKNLCINVNKKFIFDENFFRDTNVTILQRQVNNDQCRYFLNYIIPCSRKYGSWIIYNIDDCVHIDDMPKYNNAYSAYDNAEYMQNIYKMVNAADFVLVTTDELAQYYTDKFEVNPNSMIVIPNYLPKWWIGNYFNLNNSSINYIKNCKEKNKPRIGLIGSPSHYDTMNKGIKNDITDILPYIKKTIDKYQWVLFGCAVPELMEYVQRKEIEFHGGIDILHYPAFLNSLNLQCVVVPLQDCTFNRCKSNIKLTESWALGIDCIAQDLPCYSKYTDNVFSNIDELDALISNDLKSEETFLERIFNNYKKMDNWWAENNMLDWYKLYNMRQKPLVFNNDINIEKSSQEIVPPQITNATGVLNA